MKFFRAAFYRKLWNRCGCFPRYKTLYIRITIYVFTISNLKELFLSLKYFYQSINWANFDSKNDILLFFQYLKNTSLSRQMQSFYIWAFLLCAQRKFKSSYSEVFCNKDVKKFSQNLQENTYIWGSLVTCEQ